MGQTATLDLFHSRVGAFTVINDAIRAAGPTTREQHWPRIRDRARSCIAHRQVLRRPSTFTWSQELVCHWLVDDGVPVNMVQRAFGHERSSATLDLSSLHPTHRRSRSHPSVTRWRLLV